MSRKLWLPIAAVAMGALTAVVLMTSKPVTNDRWFDAALWKSATAEMRGAMVADLVGYNLSGKLTRLEYKRVSPGSPLSGKSRDEVIAILGTPDREREYSMSYNVGYMNESGYLEAPFYLIIDFGKNGSVDTITLSD